MNTQNLITIHVILTNEGGTARPTQAIQLPGERFKLLPIPDYDKVGEVWQFPPGSVVRCEKRNGVIGEYLLAVANA